MADTLSRLSDHAAIVALRVAFGHALDIRDFAALGQIFTSDIDVDLSAFGVPAGHMTLQDLVAVFRHSFRHEHVDTFQSYTNFQVWLHGDQATMISLLHGHHAGDGFEGGQTFDIRARYHDRLVRTVDGWRISGMKLEVISIEGNLAIVA